MKPDTELQQLTDRCVMCGMCLPHCPTYTKTRDEAESPRGRISLVQGLNSGRLPYSDKLAGHLDHCLTCRACEAVCPSGVAYGRIIDTARVALKAHRPPASRRGQWAWRWTTRLLGDRRLLYRATRALRLIQKSGLQTLARLSGITRRGELARLDAVLPDLQPLPAWPEYIPAQGERRGDVGLFLGCATDALDRDTLNAAIHLLSRLGYGVFIPAAQTCCGALHQHAGEPATARAFAQANLAAFDSLSLEAIISVASGCGATIAEYPRTQGRDFAAPVRDISDFLNGITWPEDTRFAPLPKKVAVHDPCSLTHVLRKQQAPYAVLRRIPQIDLLPLADNGRCCGAAGSYMLSQPEMADQLREDKIAALRDSGANILLPSNIGCALHLRAGIRAAGLDIEVLHPVSLLARQLRPIDVRSSSGN